MLQGKGTIISSIVAILFGLLLAFGIDLETMGISQEQILGAITTLWGIIAIFLRRGSKNDAASAAKVTVEAVTGSVAKGEAAGISIGTPNVSPQPKIN